VRNTAASEYALSAMGNRTGGKKLRFVGSLRLQTPGFRPKLFEGKFDYFAVTPDINRKALARVFDNHFLDGGFERHFCALFQRQIENVSWWPCHGLAYRSIKSP
jgi:hypothetical protein